MHKPFLFLTALLVCLVSPESFGGETAYSRCKNFEKFDEVRACREAALLKKYPRQFFRKQNELTIVAANGVKVRLQDSKRDITPEWHYISYELRGYFPDIACATVSVTYYEGADYLLVHLPTGQQKDGGDEIYASPDRRRVAVFGGDESSYNRNFVAVYRLNSDEIYEEYSVDFPDAYPNKLVWKNNKTIEYSILQPPASAEDTEWKPELKVIRLEGDINTNATWKIEP